MAKIKQMDVNVDLKGINTSTIKNYPLVLPKGVVRTDPAEIQISVKVKKASN